ncbi:MAG: NUDIX domain-containing protein [Myxococcota bacterium]
MNFRKHAHCSWCGAAFPDGPFPRTCTHCRRTTWLNPLPVAVLVLPVDDGVLVIRRNEGAGKGELALPGGFIDLGETWQEACARELYEETGIRIAAETVESLGVRSAPDGFLLVFGRGPWLREADLPPFVAGPEIAERRVVREPVKLAFALHEEMLRLALGRG